MPPKKRRQSKQQPITATNFLPLLQRPLEQLGKQINIPGSYWQGRMSEDERKTLYVPKQKGRSFVKPNRPEHTPNGPGRHEPLTARLRVRQPRPSRPPPRARRRSPDKSCRHTSRLLLI